MKRLIKCLIASVLALLLVIGAVGCAGGSNWSPEDVTLKDGGAVVQNGGFVAETENYYYFINGSASNVEDNNFGMPIKGSLMAVDKADLSKTCIVVPKLFVAQDYESGIFLANGYVYFGTPSTDKNASGEIANGELKFARAKLDGTEYVEYFTASSISSKYRFVEKDNVVYLVYEEKEYKDGVCDKKDEAIILFNTETKEKQVIAHICAQAEKESLLAFEFAPVSSSEDCVICYTTTVYSEAYNKTEAEQKGTEYSREKASYNNLYAYKVGDGFAEGSNECRGKRVLAGETADITYGFSQKNGDMIFITSTKTRGIETTLSAIYGTTFKGLYNGEQLKEIVNTSYLTSTNLIVSFDEVYYFDSDHGKLIQTTLVEDVAKIEKPVAMIDSISTLLFKDGDFVYYTNKSDALARIKVANVDEDKDEDVNEQRVSEGEIKIDWYKQQVINGKVFYNDETSYGKNYVKFVPVNAEVVVKKDDDGNVTECYLKDDAHVSLGKKTNADQASIIDAKVDKIAEELDDGKFVFATDDDGKVILVDGEPYVESLLIAQEAYNGATDDVKKLVSDNSKDMLKKYAKALELARLYYKLNDFDSLTKEQKDELLNAYNTAAAKVEEIKKDENFAIASMNGYAPENLVYFYQQAQKYFTTND